MPQIDLWTYYSVYWSLLIYLIIAAGFAINFLLPRLYIIMKLRAETLNFLQSNIKLIPFKYTIAANYRKALKFFTKK